jgi:hypothetical protein
MADGRVTSKHRSPLTMMAISHGRIGEPQDATRPNAD